MKNKEKDRQLKAMVIQALFPQAEDHRSAVNLLRKYAVLEHMDLYEVLCHARKGTSLLGLYDEKKLCGCVYILPHRYLLETFCILNDESYAGQEQKKAIESYLKEEYPELEILLNVKVYPV